MQSPLTRFAVRDDISRVLVAGTGIGRAAAAGGRSMRVPSEDLPATPPTWTAVSGSLSGGAQERFIGYVTERGLVVTIESVASDVSAPAARLIALITLGEHRIAIVEATEPAPHFEARWESGGRRHCLTAPATTLATFMPLVLNLDWS
ncbi:MAG TPA: hypothetical protein VGF84_04150 [Micromonosporaceae bacterium]